MNLHSKVRIEFSEEVEKGHFNTYAFESGTAGDSQLAGDLADVLKYVPRPLEVLAVAICEIYDRVKDKDQAPPLLRAAMDYAKQWEEYDRLAAKPGVTPEELVNNHPH